MMKVKSPALEGVRRSDKRSSSEGGGLSPSISTGLSLGVNGMDSTNTISSPPNTGFMSSVTSMRTPLPNATGSFGVPPMAGTAVNGNQSFTPPPLVPVGDGDFMSLSPPGVISGNQAVFLPPSIELPPSVFVTGVGSIPIMAPEMPVELQNETSDSRQSMQNLSRGVPSDTAMMAVTEKCIRDVDPQLSIATGPGSVEAVKPDLNIGYNDSETQVVSDSQGVDVTEPPLAGETEPINDAGFDDMMVVLQNDTLAASTMPLENGDQPASLFEPLQIVNTPPLEVPLDVTTSTPSGITESKVSPTHQEYDRGKVSGVESHTDELPSGDPRTPTPSMQEGLNESLLHTEGPAANGGQASKKEGLDIFEPQGLLDEGLSEKVHDRPNKGDESTPSQNGNAGNAGPEKIKVVREKDIKEIVGRKVLKKFGRKNYKGEVVDFDAENQWFKVVYEDGDQEDLKLVEVKDILLIEETSSNTSTAKRKRPLTEGGPIKRARKQKQPEGQGGGRSRGRPRKKAASSQTTKNSAKVKSLPGSKWEGSETESSQRKGSQRELQLQKTSGGKRRNADEDTEHKTRMDGKAKNGGLKKPIRKSPPKKGVMKVTKKDSAKKNTRRRSLSQLPDEQKREKASQGKSKGKRQKVDASEDEVALIGRTVEKDFDGILYKGTVSKFDKETLYFKVKYEDGDQEDLELEELKAVLVQ